jgi:endonuclease/exonuclease/phosphatase family metal-dependent hydrolase
MKFSFISLNLWLGGELFDEALDFLRHKDADIVVLQEVYNGTDSTLAPQYRSMAVLQEQLGYPYQNFVADYRDFDRTEGKSQRGNAILSKFPIAERSAVFFAGSYSETYRDLPGNYAKSPRDLQHVTLTTPSGVLDVYNIQGIWDLNGDNYSAARKHMSDVIIAEVRGKTNVVLAGDTNAKPTNKAIRDLEPYIQSVFKSELTSTFNMRRKENPGYATAVVDMIFTSSNITTLSHECPSVDISDHLPLTATFQF